MEKPKNYRGNGYLCIHFAKQFTTIITSDDFFGIRVWTRDLAKKQRDYKYLN